MPVRRLPARPIRFALPFLLIIGLLIPTFASRTAGQTSPAQGSAQVIAQGLTAPPADRVAWRVVRQQIPERIDARPSNRMQSSTGFLLADKSAIFVADQRTKLRSRLAPGEAQFIPSGANQTWANLESGATTAYSLELVDQTAVKVTPDGEMVYRGGTFTMDPVDYDMDLIRNDVPAGKRAWIETGGYPALVFATAGQLEVSSKKLDDPVRLKAGQATSLRGELTIRALGDKGATYVAVIMGDPVSGGQPAPTVEPTNAPKAKATKSARKERTATPEPAATRKPKKETPGINDGSSLRIAVRLCREGMTYFSLDPQGCKRASGDYQLALVNEDGERLRMSDASRVEPNFVRWSGLARGEYVLVVGKMPKGYRSYSLDGYICCTAIEGYPIQIGKDELIDGTLYLFREEFGVGKPEPEPAPRREQPVEPSPGVDSDGDGLSDELEINVFGTSPQLTDSDGDTIPDGVEAFGSNGYLTAPARPDTDGDGVDDNVEIQQGSDPLDPGSA